MTFSRRGPFAPASAGDGTDIFSFAATICCGEPLDLDLEIETHTQKAAKTAVFNLGFRIR